MNNVVGGSPSVLRHLNSRMVLQKIRLHGAMSKAEIIRESGLSRPTINEIIAGLISNELVAESSAGARDASRHAGATGRLYEFDAGRGTLLGVDIGANKAVIVLADMAGTIFARQRIDSRESGNAENVVGRVRKAIFSLLEQHGLDAARLKQAVVSTPGTVDPGTGRLKLAPQLPSLNGEDVAALLGLTCPTLIENEMRTAVIGERWKGVAKGQEDVVYVGLGVGIGAGILLRGNLHRGASGAAGEIGYLILSDVPEESEQSEHRAGLLESLAGSHAFEARGAAVAGTKKGEKLRELAGEPARITAETIFLAAEDHDPAALALIEEEASYIARAIAALIVVVDPSMVVAGGGMSQAGESLLGPIRSHLKKLVPGSAAVVVSSLLGDEAAAIGAIHMAMENNDHDIEHQIGTGT